MRPSQLHDALVRRKENLVVHSQCHALTFGSCEYSSDLIQHLDLLEAMLKSSTKDTPCSLQRKNPQYPETPNHRKSSSTNLIDFWNKMTTNSLCVDFSVMEHIDVHLHCHEKKLWIDAANPFSVPKSVMSSTGQPPSSQTQFR